jgi:signal transduction histidine kinase
VSASRPATPDAGRSALPGASRALLDAVVAMSTDLDLHRVLSRIVRSACELTQARYGALGVLDREDGLQDFVIDGIDPSLREQIGDLPHGRGILGVVIKDPRPLRLDDLTQHPQSYGFPPNHPPMKTFLGVPIEVQGTVFGNLYLTEKAGGRAFSEEDEETVSALAAAAGYVIGNARAYGLSERRRQWLEATGRLGDALEPPISPARALGEVTRIFRSVSGARAVAVVRTADGGAAIAAADGPEAAVLDEVVAQERGLLAGRRPESAEIVVPGGEPRWVVVLPMRSALAEADALLAVFESEDQAQDAQELQLMHTFADHVGLSLDRARAVDDREEIAILSDRDRIARDLHDLVIQRLFATGLQLQGLRMLADRPEFMQRIDKAVDDIDITIKDIRGTIFGLQNRQDASLRGAARKLAQEYASVLGFSPAVRTQGPVDTVVPPKIQVELLAVLREALSNVAKHAGAVTTVVELEADETAVRLRVRDDGVGMPADRVESGLRNARQRADALGGRFQVGPGSPRGTVLSWQVPLD